MSIRRIVPAFSLMLFVLLFTGRVLAVCGDGMCRWQEAENCEVCPVDCRCAPGEICSNAMCRSAGGCGDGQCAPHLGENCESCAMDCRCAPGQLCRYAQCTRVGGCGDGHCAPYEGENCDTCARDCGCEPHQVCQGRMCTDVEESSAREPTGPNTWCCYQGNVFEELASECERIGGIHFSNLDRAHQHCQGRFDRPPVGRGAEVGISPRDDWRRRGPDGMPSPILGPRDYGRRPPDPDATPIPLPGPRDFGRRPPDPDATPIPLPGPRDYGRRPPSPDATPITLPGPRDYGRRPPDPDATPIPLPSPVPQIPYPQSERGGSR